MELPVQMMNPHAWLPASTCLMAEDGPPALDVLNTLALLTRRRPVRLEDLQRLATRRPVRHDTIPQQPGNFLLVELLCL